MKFKLPPRPKDNIVDQYLDKIVAKIEKNRIQGRELAIAGLVHRFMLENNCKASECELVERSENNGLIFETSWFVRKKIIDFVI